MASTLAAFGLRPANQQGGGTARNTDWELAIPSGYNITLYQFTPVKLNASGQIVIAGTTGPILGTFLGYKTEQPGVQNVAYNVSPTWVSGTTLASGQSAMAMITSDPMIEYEIQASGSITQSGIGMEGNIVFTGSGNSATKTSQAALGTVSSVASGQLRVIGLARTVPGQAWGDNFTVLRVQIADHQFVAQRTTAY